MTFFVGAEPIRCPPERLGSRHEQFVRQESPGIAGMCNNYSFAILVWSIPRAWRVWMIFGNLLISTAFEEIPTEK